MKSKRKECKYNAQTHGEKDWSCKNPMPCVSEKKIIVKDEGESIIYDIQGDNVTVKDAMNMLIFAIMAVNDEATEGLTEVEKYKSKKELKKLVDSIFD